MKLNDEQRQQLHRALAALDAGSTSAYHDAMWLGFGDVWSQLEQQLSRAGAIRVRGRFGEHVDLTEAGSELVQRLVA